jgi:hypothetical protein
MVRRADQAHSRTCKNLEVYRAVEDVANSGLGLTLQDKSVTHIEDFNGTELLFPGKEKDLTLMVGGAWKHMGATPFRDDTETLRRFIAAT